MAAAQVPGSKLTGDEERKQFAATFGKPLVKGENWYVISRKWLQSFCDFSGFVAERPNETGKAGALRPGPITNQELLVAGSTKELKKEITLQDYELIHSSSWNLIHGWYGGGPVLKRDVITVGLMAVERVELYPAFLTILGVDSKTGEPVPMPNAPNTFSSQSTLTEIVMSFQPGFDGKEPDKNAFNWRIWIRDDGKRSTTDELLSKAAEVQAANDKDKSAEDKAKEAEKKKAEEAKVGIASGWKLVHGDTYINKLDTHEFKADTELMLEYRKDISTNWARRTGKLNWREFEMNDILDCADHRRIYFESLIRDVKEDKLLVHFINWSTKWDEWIPKNSDRLAPRNMMTTGPYMPKEDGPSLQRLNSQGPPPEKGAVGLRNLGNTCFMNSTLQCLSNTPGLTQFFVDDKFLAELNTNNALGWGGKIAMEYAKLIKDIWSGKFTTVAPRALKDAIGEYQPRFSGYQQHDSSELLSFLLDGLHEDLNRVKKKPATQPVDSGGRPDPIVAVDSWYRHLQRNQSIIVDTCQGQLKSRVVCPKCKRESITFDPFMFLSVPLPEASDMIQPVTFLAAAPGSAPKNYAVKCSKLGDIAELKDKLGKMSNTNPANYIVTEVWNNRFYKIFANDYSLMKIGARDAIWIYECPTPAPAANTPPDAPKEEWIQAQLAHFVGTGKLFQLTGVPAIINLKNWALKAYPNAEIHAVCKATMAGFMKGAKWEDKEEPNYEVYLCDKGGKETRGLIAKDGTTDLIAHGGFSICCRWVDVDRWAPGPVAEQTAGEDGGKKGISLDDCMEAFTKEEVLRKSEAWYCSACKDHLCATKKFDVWRTPDVLILHLKRFSYNHLWRDKIGTFVDFPVENLDIKDWVVNKDEKNTVYDLFAVSNHFGGLGGGHYTAYGKNILDKKWYNLDDSSVTPLSNPNQVRTAAAYVLFYCRRGRQPGQVKHTLEAAVAAARALGATSVGGQPLDTAAGPPTAAAPAVNKTNN